jgi:hypothetical protein
MFSGFCKQGDFIRLQPALSEKGVKIVPNRQFNVRPVIESGPFDFTAVNGKSERLNQVQGCVCTNAASSDIAGIPVNFRSDEDHMTFRFRGHLIVGFVLKFKMFWVYRLSL